MAIISGYQGFTRRFSSSAGLSTVHISPDEVNGVLSQADLSDDEMDFYLDHARLWQGRLDRLQYNWYRDRASKLCNNENLPAIVTWDGARLVEIWRGGRGLPGAGGVRGRVRGFSSQSRLRLMRLLAKTRIDTRPVFVTMTYPDELADNVDLSHFERWKRDIDAFGKRFRRQFPAAGFVWRMEVKDRESGRFVGQLFPHFHLLVWGVAYRELLAWVAVNWWQVCGELSSDHLSAGTRVENLHTKNGVLFYISKYLAKIDQSEALLYGRWWGIIGRECLPWGHPVVNRLHVQEAVHLLRLARRYIRRRRGSRYQTAKMSFIAGSADWWRNRLDDIILGDNLALGHI